ncbi:Bro-N domain-containing protein [Enterobacter ludwigii]|uniref:BRO-N domain-containing protein n=1 Tax=Enterobacter ludwigii TaxID=299767 RepID=UPI003BEF0E80
MNNQVTHFYFEHHSSVRVQVIDGEPWFCLSDVAKILDIKNTSQLAGQLDIDGICKTYITDSLARQQGATFVNEPNLYRVIFRSNKPEAKQFQDWVFNEVLPTIRKTGHYAHPVCNKPKAEPLTPSDMGNLNHLVTLMSMSFKRQSTWSRGIWYALRRASGVPSPDPFTVNDLPALAEECRRIIKITSTVNEMISRIEKEAVRRILRNREEYVMVVEQLQREVDSCGLDDAGQRNLENFERLALTKLEKRIAA